MNLGVGGEIGRYRGTGNVVSTTMSEHLGITMSMIIADKNGNEIIDYAPRGEQHWLPGWDPKVQGMTSEDLIMTGTLVFSNSKDSTIYDKLKAEYENSKNNPRPNHIVKSNWEFDDKKKIAKFSWEY